jgi:hypothetical protein
MITISPQLMFWLAAFSFFVGGVMGIIVRHAYAEEIAHRKDGQLKDAKDEVARLRAQVAHLIGR